MRALRRGFFVSFCAAAMFMGCGDRSLRPLTPCTNAGVSQSLPIDDVKNVDLLFMVDNSGSMREEQTKLRREFPRMVRALVTGDIDGDGNSDGPAVSSLRVGVVTSDMGVGGIGTMVGEQAISSCGAVGASVDSARANYGDDGVMRHTGTSAAASGSDPAVDCDTMPVDGNDDTITDAALPAYMTFDGTMSGNMAAVDEYVRRVSCMANAGTGGCAFEQQLESVLKAITPPNDTTVAAFHTAPNDSARAVGHGCAVYNADGSCNTTDPAQGGDIKNAGWFRNDSLMAIVVISDEDDCSASDRRAYDFNLTSGPYADMYTRFQAQTRCERYATDLVHPVDRYVNGIINRRALSPSRIVYAVITGVPPTLTDEDDEGTDNIGAILAAPEMQYNFLTLNRPAGTAGAIIPVPNADLAEVCHHTVAQVSTAGTGNTVDGSTTISNAMFGAVVPFVGMGLSGTDIAAGTLVTAVTGAGPYTLTVDEPAIGTGNATVIDALEFDLAGTGSTTSGSGTLANFMFTGGAVPAVGMILSGAGIQTGTTIQAVTGAGPYSITMSQTATATAAGVAITARLLDVAAAPARRIVGVADGLRQQTQNQANSIVQSICVDDFRPAMRRILQLIQANLAGGCLPRKLIRNALNEVNCGVFITLPPGDTCAAHPGVYDESRTTSVTIAGMSREKCTMNQVPVTGADVGTGVAPAGASGWFYDDYTMDLSSCGSTQTQRISFTTDAKPPQGAILDFGCTQPVQDGDLAVDISSECGAGDTCAFPTPESEAAFTLRYNLPSTFTAASFACELDSRTCQITCNTDADCPGGFVCYNDPNDVDGSQGNNGAGQICVNPTCGSGF